ncbi:MAG: lipid A biosynthesis acyltransferase [Betaproteobacteria bacterium]|nr:lipid A biosynthesis acyltransferase [Betaproteobacteria bacterium]
MMRLLTLMGLWCARGLAFSPEMIRRPVAGLLGRLAHRFARQRRAVAETNLRLCFPGWTDQQRASVVRQHFDCYARAFIERFIVWFGSEDALRSLVKLEGLEHFQALQGRPVIVLAPHFLGLDAGGLRFQLEQRFVSMYSNQSNPVLNAWTLRGRCRFNDPIMISRQQGIGTLARWVRRGLPAYFLPDLDFGSSDALFVPFFGVPAATVTSVVRLSRSLDAVVLPLVTSMTARGYVARFYPGWKHPNDDQQETLAQGVERMNRFIEQSILSAPEQYLWTHRRFKSRPPGEPPVYG